MSKPHRFPIDQSMDEAEAEAAIQLYFLFDQKRRGRPAKG
jgi:hypothetical protein